MDDERINEEPIEAAMPVEEASTSTAAEEEAAVVQASADPLSPQEERTWAMLAHLSILLNLVSGILGVAAALVIYLIYKDRSRYVAYQAMQAFLFQLVAWVGSGLIVGLTWGAVSLLAAVVIGICLIPVAAIISLLPLAAIVYAIIAAVKCNEGEDFRYWLIGEWAEGLVG